MRKILLTFIVCCCYIITSAQTIIKKDAAIETMVAEVNSDSLRSYITKMVSYGTRNTLSAQSDTKRGIGAARLWVLQKFNEFARKSGGRLSAFIDTTTLQPDGRRVNRPLVLGNVVAT